MDEPSRLQVHVRLRSLADPSQETAEMTATQHAISIRMNKSTAQGKDSVEETSFTFDGVFDPTATQAEVYATTLRPQVDALLAGRDTLTFACTNSVFKPTRTSPPECDQRMPLADGITNAGKTYTIRGKGDGDELGVLPRALKELFEKIQQRDESSSDPSCAYEVVASFLEVYGNDAFDLLATPEKGARRPTLRLKEERGHFSAEGLTELSLDSFEAASAALETGWQQRQARSIAIFSKMSRAFPKPFQGCPDLACPDLACAPRPT